MLQAVMEGGAMRFHGRSTIVEVVVGLSAVVWLSPVADAQLTDITQAPRAIFTSL
jgi:hypothetical protein